MEISNKISEENKSLFRRFRRWIIVQKYTLQRGYGNVNIFLLGFICATSIKALIPGIIDTMGKFVLLSIFGLIGLYFIGWLDKRLKFLNEENAYTTITNPLMMELINNAREEKNTLE